MIPSATYHTCIIRAQRGEMGTVNMEPAHTVYLHLFSFARKGVDGGEYLVGQVGDGRGWLADRAITSLLINQSLKSLSAFFVSRDFGLFQSHRAFIL